MIVHTDHICPAEGCDSLDRGCLNYIGGWFNYASGFTINHPLMAEHIHVHKQASTGTFQ